MPIVHITLLEGRDTAAIKQCLKDVAQAVHLSLGAPLQNIRVLATEVPHTHWAVGLETRDEKPAPKAGAA